MLKILAQIFAGGCRNFVHVGYASICTADAFLLKSSASLNRTALWRRLVLGVMEIDVRRKTLSLLQLTSCITNTRI